MQTLDQYIDDISEHQSKLEAYEREHLDNWVPVKSFKDLYYNLKDDRFDHLVDEFFSEFISSEEETRIIDENYTSVVCLKESADTWFNDESHFRILMDLKVYVRKGIYDAFEA